MTEITREKLNKILEEHKHWINKVFTSLSADRKQLITNDSEECKNDF